MSDSDKRSVHTDALATLGTIIDETAGRDAIHLAVHPVVAKVRLMPGEDVCADGSQPWVGHSEAVGIVDPFLKKDVRPGEMFWLVIYPRKITSLRHVWSHPSFPDESEVKTAERTGRMLSGESEDWLRDFANRKGYGYEGMIAAALISDGESVHLGNQTNGETIPPEFWDHIEAVAGKVIPANKRGSWFSCAC